MSKECTKEEIRAKLSDEQRSVLDRSGHFAVKACPGSGKTFMVSAKLAYLIQDWTSGSQGIAAISFTNTAWQEMRNKLETEFGISHFGYPHFCGTIDSFINQYLFLPFGHLTLGSSCRPKLVGEPHGPWTSKYKDPDRPFTQNSEYFPYISKNIHDNLITLNNRIMTQERLNAQIGSLKAMKTRLWHKGLATQSDANYHAFKLLETYPHLAQILVNRFPVMIIDEAQDTHEVHMKIIDKLLDAGLENCLLVGDPDQSIFEWNNARTEFFRSKYDAWSTNSMSLLDNYRSSRFICNFTHGLSSLKQPSRAVGLAQAFPETPEIFIYDISNLNAAIEKFRARCQALGIVESQEQVAVLYRSKEISRQLYQSSVSDKALAKEYSPWQERTATLQCCKFGSLISEATYLYDQQQLKAATKCLQKGLKMAFRGDPITDDDLLDDEHNYLHRKSIIQLLFALPNPEQLFPVWVAEANRILEAQGFAYAKMNLTRRNKANADFFETVTLNSYFHQKYVQKRIYTLPYRSGTIHSVKGETFDAVLLLLREKAANGSYYRNLLKEYSSEGRAAEELRNVYVALTRPRKLLMLGVPNRQDLDAWAQRLRSAETGSFHDVNVTYGQEPVRLNFNELAVESHQLNLLDLL